MSYHQRYQSWINCHCCETYVRNQIRKLEFLLADAIAQGCDCVVTAGGQQRLLP